MEKDEHLEKDKAKDETDQNDKAKAKDSTKSGRQQQGYQAEQQQW